MDDTPVDTCYRAFDVVLWAPDPLLPDAYGGEPPPRPPGDGGAQDMAPRREVSPLLQLDPAECRKANHPVLDSDGACQGERLFCPVPFALERRPAEAVSADQEVVEGASQVP